TGNDAFVDGAGDDSFHGGAGGDTFVFVLKPRGFGLGKDVILKNAGSGHYNPGFPHFADLGYSHPAPISSRTPTVSTTQAPDPTVANDSTVFRDLLTLTITSPSAGTTIIDPELSPGDPTFVPASGTLQITAADGQNIIVTTASINNQTHVLVNGTE